VLGQPAGDLCLVHHPADRLRVAAHAELLADGDRPAAPPGVRCGIEQDDLEREISGRPDVAWARLWTDDVGALHCAVVPAGSATELGRYLAACARPQQLWVLPDGSPVFALNGHELAYMAWEQTTWDAYRLGDLHREDAVVVDAGANIGLFSLLAASRVPAARVLAIEPVPALVEVVDLNARLHGVADRVTAVSAALGRAPGATDVRFSPFFAALSSSHREERAAICRRLVLAIKVLLPDLARGTALDLGDAKRWIEHQLQETVIPVDVRPLSDLLREHGIERVDLLKVDVEGAELDVLDGVDDRDWPRIQRVAMEVNDVDGRFDSVTARLVDAGFEVTVDVDDSASRVTPGRIGIVHGVRGPSRAARTASQAPPQPLREPAVLDAAAALFAGLRATVAARDPEAARRCHLHLCDLQSPLLDPTQEDPRDAPFLEALSGHLATLLGVPPLSLAEGWAAGSLGPGEGAGP
jgi:FkbM family methyltransferase